MRSFAHAARAFGFTAVLLVPALLAWSALEDKPFLVAGVVFILFPLGKLVFGVVPRAAAAEPLNTATLAFLNTLPRVYALGLAMALALTMLAVSRANDLPIDIAGWIVSLWLTLTLGTCVAHALLHSRSVPDRRVGHLLAGITGYPVLGYEHLRHHHRPGDTRLAEWPRRAESVWAFAWRRGRLVARETLGRQGLAFRGGGGSASAIGLRIGIVGTLLTAAGATALGGLSGLAVYAVVALLVWFSTQAVTYLQHWGLGDDSIADARAAEAAWEDDCQLQAWATLGLSLHQAHHRDEARPFHELVPAARAPQPPAGYVLLLLASMVPPLWRAVMEPALEQWKADPSARVDSGRKIVCTSPRRAK